MDYTGNGTKGGSAKPEMKLNLIETKEILELEAELGVELVVSERTPHYNLPRFYTSFERAEIAGHGGVLIGVFGNGDTMDEAIANYAREIENRKLIVNAYDDNRKEILLPRLRHTKLLGR